MADVISRVDEQLRAEMVEAQAAVARWATEQKHFADSVALDAQRTLETDKENVAQLREELDAVGSSGDALQHRAREERQKVEELRGDLERLATQESKLPPEQQRLSSALAQHRSLVSQREAGCEATLAAKEAKLAELHKGCTLYRQRLGLAFERVGDERLRLTFVNIDPAAPMRPFSFQVFVDAGDKYHVEMCEPAIPNMEELLAQLNTGNDFSRFVRDMRKGFKALVA